MAADGVAVESSQAGGPLRSDGWFRALVESLHGGIVVHDADGVIVESNGAAHRILGLTADQMSGRTSVDPRWRAVHEDGSPFPGDTHPAMVTLATGEPVRDVVMGVHKPDGSLTWILINSSLLPSVAGMQVVVSFTDVTEVRALEQRYQLLAESLAEASLQLSVIVDNTADVVARLAPDGTVLWVSPSMLPVFGWDPAGIVGARFRLAAPESRRHMSEVMARAVRDRAEGFSARLPVVCADGSRRWADTHNRLVWNATGELDSMVVVVRDVSEEVAAQQLAQRMLENATDVVFELAADNTYVWVSPSVTSVLGWAPEQMLGKSAADFVPPEDLARIVEARSHPDAAGAAAVDEFRYRQADGTYRWMSGVSREVADDSGQIRSRIVGLRDVQALVEARREAEAAGDRFRALLEVLPDPTFVFAAVREDESIVDLRFVDLNAAAARLFGRDKEGVIGHTLRELFPGTQGLGLLGFYIDSLVSRRPDTMRVPGFDEGGVSGSFDISTAIEGEELVVVARDITDSLAAQEALAASEGRYRLLAENASDVVAQSAPDGTIEWVSGSVTSLLGWRPADMLGRKVYEYLHPDDLPAIGAAQTRLAHGEPLTFEARVRRADGEYRWVASHVRPVLNENGDVTGRVAGWRDVHDQHLAVEALADSEQRYRLLAENATDAVYRVALTGVIEWVSPAVQRLLGWDPKALIGTKSAELVHFEDLRTYRSMIAGIEDSQTGVTWEFRARQADGDYRWMSAVTSPLIDDAKTLVGRITTLRDIDQQVRARKALARSEQTFRLAMAGAPQGMAVVGLHGPILQTNQVLCDLVGRDDAWLTCHKEVDILHPDDIKTDLAVRDRLLAGEREYHTHEIRLVDADGAEIWVQHSLALVRDEYKMPVFYVSQYQDITAARTLRSELQHRASHDALTGLINRDELSQRITQHLAHAPRRQGMTALLYCDLDYFKNVNDTHGHSVGDVVLQRTAEQITSVLRDTDEVARIGGDEFVVLLADIPDAASALKVAEKIRAAVAEAVTSDGHTISLTLSVGVALAEPRVDAHRLLRNADQALYHAKEQGRDQTSVYSTE